MRIRIFLFLSVLFVILTSCTSMKSFEHWPTSEIDRPYTLPDKIDSWQSELNGTIKLTGNGLKVNDTEYSVFNWSQSLSDNWELEWSPLPLSFKHQLYYNNIGYFGFEFGVVPLYSTSEGWGIFPVIEISILQKIEKLFACKITGNSSFFIPFNGTSIKYLGQIEPEAIIKIDNLQSLALGISAIYTNFYDLGNFSVVGVDSMPNTNMNLSIGGHYLISLGRHCDFTIKLSDYLINNNGLNASINIVNYW